MGLNIDANKAVNLFKGSDNLKDIVSNVLAAAKNKDFDIIGYHCLSPIGLPFFEELSFLSFAEYSEQDDVLYRQSGCYRHNPFISLPLRQGHVMFWSDIVEAEGLTRRNKKFIDFLSLRFSGEGLAVPVYGPRGQNGVVFFKLNDVAPTICEGEMIMLQATCQQGHISVCKILQTKDQRALDLTLREKEVLEAVVLGLSNTQIAASLKISIHIVKLYLKRLFLKLGTTDRVSTALRGVALGIVN
jgi:DNA-binding CsgD family transcriptional regulator